MRQRRAAVAVLCTSIITLTGCSAAPSPRPTNSSLPPTPSPSASFLTVQDRGPIEFAQGDVLPIGAHRYRYTVAAGDTMTGISRRFGACVPALSDQSRGGTEIFAGDTLVIEKAGLSTNLDICAAA